MSLCVFLCDCVYLCLIVWWCDSVCKAEKQLWWGSGAGGESGGGGRGFVNGANQSVIFLRQCLAVDLLNWP